MPPKRGRDPLDDPKSGPSKHQLKGLAYVGKQPSFLRNAAAALSGQTGSSGNRAPIPTRPEGYGDDDQDDAASDRDDWDLDRGDDEAPQVVVLKEGKHIGKDEVDRIRAEAKASNSEDPLHTTDTAAAAKGKGSLAFSTGTSAKTKAGGAGGNGDWADVVRSSRDDDGVKRSAPSSDNPAKKPGSKSIASTAEDRAKAEKKKVKEKKKAKKQIGLLSFDEE
ncbi:hypothetical protein C6P46_003432 [Rhodotorula mucilaginosa]|uniref:DUF4604 domain-containing protein n=1 Tax=Rhodotorula mucilaginosa TaxID=5537 RepID=A0A9P6W4A9_RHOMI|nr:hypothetical protein C6P46_003432 [Rhodotorula mucilaginosa]